MTETDKIESLLRDLAGSFIAHPESLRIGRQTSQDGLSVYFGMSCHPQDEAKLVGRSGCHVDSLDYLVAELGRVRGQTWTFRLITPKSANGSKFEPAKETLSYDPEPAAALLRRLMANLNVPCTVSVGPGEGPRDRLSFVLTITVADEWLYSALMTPPLIEVIGTLWRAIGKFNGVRFQINVAKV